ncbi:MAG: hydantoinase/carbamoylase family amidase [Proteobacteria bacterium]|nr:hydantoinase/carbamoylase family amidase [Pseudomonadota bacterium]
MIEPDLGLAERLFAELAAKTRHGAGIVRDSYGEGEQLAHELMRATGRSLGLEVNVDAAGNSYMTLPGRDRALPALLMGSHLDSVPQGGNYDGAAGVIAGLALLAGCRQAKFRPAFDVTVMGIRAEEAAWFDASYVGAYAAFGRLAPEVLNVRRSDSGRTLAEHMAETDCDVAAVRDGSAYLKPERLRRYLELHIEQGPVLVGRGVPVGIVTGIRGCRRYRHARCIGAYGHSGAMPRRFRQDAVAATVALIHQLNRDWVSWEAEGHDLTFTSGELYTDPAMHGPSKIAGETRFVLDFRSISDETMQLACARAQALGRDIADELHVEFDLGAQLVSAPASLDVTGRDRLSALAGAAGIASIELASGAGHDAAVFANFGVPANMIFIRNEHGSHNPDEAMAMADFADAVRLLGAFVSAEAT